MATAMSISARRVGRHLTASRVAHSHTSSLSQQPQYLVGADAASKRSFASKKKKSKNEEEVAESYFDRKAASKQLRVEAYKHKLERAVRIQSRRDNSPKDVKKDEFRSWWSGRMAYEEKMDRKARQAGMDWTIQVATIVERLPIVMPDKEGFETEFEDLQAYLQAHRGKEYPKEFVGSGGRPEAYTDEELMALLPDTFQPAPRETKADEDGTVNTLDRRLKDRVFLMVGDSFPTTQLKLGDDDQYGDECETLLDAALRGLKEKTSKKDQLELYCASKTPIGVRVDVYDEEQQKSTGCFGTKTFFVKVQYDEGTLNGKDIAWLDRSEVVERFRAASNGDEANFFKYLL